MPRVNHPVKPIDPTARYNSLVEKLQGARARQGTPIDEMRFAAGLGRRSMYKMLKSPWNLTLDELLRVSDLMNLRITLQLPNETGEIYTIK